LGTEEALVDPMLLALEDTRLPFNAVSVKKPDEDHGGETVLNHILKNNSHCKRKTKTWGGGLKKYKCTMVEPIVDERALGLP